MRRRSSQTSPLILAQSPCEKCLLRESSFNMTKGGGGGGRGWRYLGGAKNV